jgi:hypothetical protein
LLHVEFNAAISQRLVPGKVNEIIDVYEHVARFGFDECKASL